MEKFKIEAWASAAFRLHTQCSVKGGDVDSNRKAAKLSDSVNKTGTVFTQTMYPKK
jgi:hypothetical protein